MVSGDDAGRNPSPTVHQGRSASHVSWADIERYGPTDLCPTSTRTTEKVRQRETELGTMSSSSAVAAGSKRRRVAESSEVLRSAVLTSATTDGGSVSATKGRGGSCRCGEPRNVPKWCGVVFRSQQRTQHANCKKATSANKLVTQLQTPDVMDSGQAV